MRNKLIAFIGLFLFLAGSALAQDTNPVLFTVKGNPVRVDEFKYIYAKTNQDKADFSEASLREYLDLYIKFKLKVQKARDMRLDTVSATKTELDGYRRQLANSYLVDKEVTDKLVREAYDRMQQDADISHIFIACDRNASAKDTLAAYKRAQNILKLVRSGKDFEQMAIDSSMDKTVKENRGNLGYVNAMLPDGYYEMEKAVYAAKPGDIVGPVRSNGGYHVVRVNGFRPARGEMEVAQILIRKGDTPEKQAQARMRADSVYAALQTGAKWDEVCARYSDDKNTAAKGGYIGFFGINRYQKNFEDAAFALAKDGDYTKPVETTIGFHIVKRVSHRGVGPYEQMKRGLTERVKRDSRSEIAKQSMINRIKREGNYKEYPEALAQWTAQQHDTLFHTFRWKPDPSHPQTVLMQFGPDKKYTVADFEEYCVRASRDRMRGKGYPVNETVNKLYKSWTDETAMQFEETQLEKKYPDFKSLMREYEEGILLFDATKQYVWDRANTDSTGLEQYFRTNLSGKYKWDERATVSYYTIKTDDPALAKKVRDFAAKKPAADVLKKFNKKGQPEVVMVSEKKIEKGKNKDLEGKWMAGTMNESKVDTTAKTTTFFKVEAIEPPSPKGLADARGYAVADYQDYLEKQWIEELRKEYPVQVNEEVLKSLVRRP
ncbi:MAG: peptidylprolyl isomerase [Saprospiraceae bacterium]